MNIQDFTKDYIGIAPKKTMEIDRITIHSLQSNETTLERINRFFLVERIASGHLSSVNYAIDDSGNIGLYVPEDRRAWTSSSSANDGRAITIECATTAKAPYTLYEKTEKALTSLLVDLCKRYGKKGLVKLSKEEALSGKSVDGYFAVTEHNYFAVTDCPGPDIQKKLPAIIEKVNALLGEKKKGYRVQVGYYSVKENAEAKVKALKAAGFDAFIREEEE